MGEQETQQIQIILKSEKEEVISNEASNKIASVNVT